MAFKKHKCQRCHGDLSHRHHSAKYCADCRVIKSAESTRNRRAKARLNAIQSNQTENNHTTQNAQG